MGQITHGTVADSVYSASEAGFLAQGFVENQRDAFKSGTQKRITFGMPSLDKYLNPFMAGDLVITLGRPAQGKSLMANYILDKTLKELAAGDEPNKVAILIATEESVERSALYWMARIAGVSIREAIRGELTTVEFDKLGIAALKLGGYPLFIIGHSTERSQKQKRKRPNLTMENMSSAIEYILNDYGDADTQIEPEIIVIDYLQRLHKSPRLDRSEAMLQWVDWSKELALWAGAPVFLMVQAGRGVEERDIRLPELNDAQWTSNVEQSATFAFSVWMPWTARYTDVPSIGRLPAMEVDENLLLFAVLKQKDGAAGEVFALHVEPEYLIVREKFSHAHI